METCSGHRQPRRQQEGASTEHVGDEGTTGTSQGLRVNVVAKREHTSTAHSSCTAREFGLSPTAGSSQDQGEREAQSWLWVGCCQSPWEAERCSLSLGSAKGLGLPVMPPHCSPVLHTSSSTPLLLALQAPRERREKLTMASPESQIPL